MSIAEWLGSRFELSRHSSGGNLASMEGLRGFAVILVFAVHFCTLARAAVSDSKLLTILDVLERLGHSGVDLFFVLSGHLIYGALITRPRPFGSFMRRRIQRIYPTFLAVFAIYLLLSLLVPSQSKLPEQGLNLVLFLIGNLLLLPGIYPMQPMITVAWSLSYEMFFYLVMPALIWLFGLRAMPVARRNGVFIALAVAVIAGCAVWSGPMRMAMFISGALLYECLGQASARRFPVLLVIAALTVAAMVDLQRPDGAFGYALRTTTLFVAFWLLCFSCFAQSTGILAHVFAWTPLRWLGNMSYSYYLIRGLTLKLFFILAGKMAIPLSLNGSTLTLMAVLSFSVTLISSAILFLLVERPLSLLPVQFNGRSIAAAER